MQEKHVPLRKCLGCGEMIGKKGAVRIVRSKEGEISLDFRGKAPGRGAYLCPDAACLKRAIKAKALNRAFETEIPQEIYDDLLAKMEEADHG